MDAGETRAVMTIRVNLRELINFYDSDAAMAKHANAIKIVAGEELNLAVLTHYFTSRGATANLLDAKCNTGPLKGSRLDAWLRVATDTVTFYQVEVKAWSFHGYGGGPALSIEHEPAEASGSGRNGGVATGAHRRANSSNLR
jgi:hypothetical protein